jgi:hypothetical protein
VTLGTIHGNAGFMYPSICHGTLENSHLGKKVSWFSRSLLLATKSRVSGVASRGVGQIERTILDPSRQHLHSFMVAWSLLMDISHDDIRV